MSVQAITWALSLPVGPSPKLTLVAIGNYADERGCAWPSVDRLASDTSQSRATVQRRLKELEGDGLLIRMARYERDGRRTSDEIRLCLDVRAADIAHRESDADDDSSDAEDGAEAQGGGSQIEAGRVANCDGEGSTAVTRGGYHSCDPNEPPLEPSESPTPKAPSLATRPQGGRGEHQAAPETRPAIEPWLTEFRSVYPMPSNNPAVVAQRAAALTADERGRAMRGARGVRAFVDAAPAKRKPPVKAPEKFLADPTLWAEYERHAPAEPIKPVWVVLDSPEWRARSVLAAIRQQPMPRTATNPKFAGEGAPMRPLPPHVEALARFADTPREEWPIVPDDTVQWMRWSQWLRSLGVQLVAEMVRTGRTIRQRDHHGREIEAPLRIKGARLPAEWPPAKSAGTGPPGDASSDEAAAQMAQLQAGAERAGDEFLRAERR